MVSESPNVVAVLARIYVDDLDVALPLYGALSDGAEPHAFAFRGMRLAMVGSFLLIEGADAEARSRAATILVRDVGAVARQVAGAGGEVLEGPAEGPNGPRLVARHPDGSVLEYIALTRSRPTHDRRAPAVRQLRLVVEAEDFETALSFYRDTLGLAEQAAFTGDGDARVAILDAGSATLELSNPAQVRMIDRVEAGGVPSDRIRVAFEVGDTSWRTAELVAAGAQLIAEPRETPWRSLNSRLRAPAGLQLTLFQELAEHETPG